jgi:HK97 family phage portal protein
MPAIQLMVQGQPEWLNPDTWDAYEIYMTTPQLYSVIQRKGYLLSSGVWKHYDKNGEEIKDSEVVKLLDNPNPLLNGRDYIRQWNENKSIHGNNYEYLNRIIGSEIPATLFNIEPFKIEIETTGKYYKQTDIEGIIKQYRLVYGNTTEDIFEPSEINHTKIPNGQNPIKGDSPMRAVHMPISNIRAAYAFRNVIMSKHGALGILSNGSASPEGAIPLTPKERTRIEKQYQKTYGLDNNQLQVIMSNSKLEWQAMSYPTKDLMLFEEVEADFKAIIDAYGLNDNIFSREKASTFTNLAEGLRQAYESTIIPESEEISLNRTRIFGLQEKGECVKLTYDHIPVLQADKVKEAERIDRIANAAQKLEESTIFSREESRDLLGMD